MLDATRRYDQPLTAERLSGWHASLFPTGRSGMHPIAVGVARGPHGIDAGGVRPRGPRARAGSSQRFYSMSAQIRDERGEY
ncbi:MAG TPA: hypothetical protein VIL35_12290 [Vicinamibacterales bacterium]